MKIFYLHNGTEQLGPFDLEELKTKNITNETPIWYEGIPDWTTADKVDEIKDLLTSSIPPPFGAKAAAAPPPIKKPSPTDETEPKKKRSSLRTFTILAIIVALVFGGIVIADKMSNKGSHSYEKKNETYQEKVMSVEEIERSQPDKFLDASGTFNENFWGTKFKVHVTITNKATVATYKDAVIRINYYSKTKTILGSKDYTIYDIFPPNSTKNLELKIDEIANATSLGWDVIKATPY